jgi:hypothetical protein
MAKRITKADRILNDARSRVNEAKALVVEAERELADAESKVHYLYAGLNAYSAAYEALEKELTPQTRKKADKPSASAPAQKEAKAEKVPASKEMCAFVYPDQSACNCAEGNPVHEPEGGYAGYHPFEPAKPERKPRKKKDAPAVIPPSTEGVDGNGLAAEMEG